MIITQAGQNATIPVSSAVATSVTAVTLSRNGNVYQLPITVLNENQIRVTLPTNLAGGDYSYAYGDNAGILRIATPTVSQTTYGNDYTVVEYNSGAIDPSDIIDDTQTSLTKTYSSHKIQGELNLKANQSTTYTKTEVDTAVGAKQDTLVSGQNIKTLNGQSMLGSGDITVAVDAYTKAQTDALLNAKANTATTYSKSEVYSKVEADSLLLNKADKTDTYTKAQVDNALAGKADTATTYTKIETDALLLNKANTADVYAKTEVYTKTETDAELAKKADTATTYSKTDTDTLLASKANSTDVYTKTQTDAFLSQKADTATTYNKTEVDALIAALPTFSYRIVTALPETGEVRVIYLVPKADQSEQSNIYVEWLWVEYQTGLFKWEKIGDTAVDLSNYYTKEETDDELLKKADTATTYTKTEVDTELLKKANTATTYTKTDIDGFLAAKANTATTYTKTEVDTALTGKQDTLVSGSNIKTINGSTILGSGDLSLSGLSTYDETTESIITEAVVRNNNKMNTKQDILVAGQNIKTINSGSTLGSGNIDLVTPNQLSRKVNQYTKTKDLNEATNIINEAVYNLNSGLTNTYTKAQADALLAQKASTATTYTRTQVDTMFTNYYDKTESYSSSEVDTLLDAKASTATTYTKSDVDALLMAKANTATTYTKTTVDSLLNQRLAYRFISQADYDALGSYNQNTVYLIGIPTSHSMGISKVYVGTSQIEYSEAEIQALLAAKADTATTYTKTEVDTALLAKANTATTYSKTEVDALIAALPSFTYQIVDNLPASGTERVIYLVKVGISEGTDRCDEYLWVNDNGTFRWEKIGSTRIDLSQYYTKAEANGIFRLISQSYTKTEVDSALLTKANANNVYEKSQTYSQAQVNSLINDCATHKILTQADYNAEGQGRPINVLYLIDNQQGKGIETMYVGDNKVNVYSTYETDGLLNTKADKSTTYTKTEVDTALNGKQATLVSGTNIKTVNNLSLLGSGNITVGTLNKRLLTQAQYDALGTYDNDTLYVITDAQ